MPVDRWHNPGVADRAAMAWARRRDPVRWILAAMVGTWALTFVVLCWLRHVRFWTYGFDLGIYDQGIWLLSRLREPFVTIKGLNLFGHHMNPILVLFVPFYWLGAGPLFLLVVQVAAQASGAVAIYLLGRDRVGDRWLALVLAGVLLLNPTYQFLTWEFFHPDALAIAPVLFAYWAARTERWRVFGVAAVVAVLCKEDVALVVAGIGLLAWFRTGRRAALVAAVASFGWFLLSTRVLMRLALGGRDPFYDSYFPELGRNAAGVVRTVLTRPWKVLDLARRRDRLAYYWAMLAPFGGFLPLVAVETTVLVAGPLLAVAVLTSDPYTRDPRYHYSAMVVAGLAVATVEGVAICGRTPALRRFLVGFLAATSLAATAAWGPSPLSTTYRTYWPLGGGNRVGAKQQATRQLPGDGVASVSYDFVTHLDHRPTLYQFPEPWVAVAWGLHGENLPDPAGVRWLVIDRTRLLDGPEHRLLDSLLAGQFRIRYDRDDVVVAERVLPP